MAEIFPYPQSIAREPVESKTEIPVLDKDLPAYRYARALCETARASAAQKTKTFKQSWDFFLGRDQWSTPGSTAAQQLDSWAFKGVVNWCFATIKTKAAMITSAPADIFCDPLDDESTYYDRLLVMCVIEDDLARLYFYDH